MSLNKPEAEIVWGGGSVVRSICRLVLARRSSMSKIDWGQAKNGAPRNIMEISHAVVMLSEVKWANSGCHRWLDAVCNWGTCADGSGESAGGGGLLRPPGSLSSVSHRS